MKPTDIPLSSRLVVARESRQLHITAAEQHPPESWERRLHYEAAREFVQIIAAIEKVALSRKK